MRRSGTSASTSLVSRGTSRTSRTSTGCSPPPSSSTATSTPNRPRPKGERSCFFDDTCIHKERTVVNLAEHPTVRQFHETHGDRPDPADPPQSLDAAWLRQLCLDCGADDAGL